MKLSAAIILLLATLVGLFSLWPPAPVLAVEPTPSRETVLPEPTRVTPRPSLQVGGEIFDQPTVLDFRFRLSPTNLAALETNPREYTPVSVTVNGVEFTNVGVKLKGAAGSYRPVTDRPALTVSFNRFVENRRLFGLRRIHLNNSVQDPTLLNEYVASELFRAAGVPTPRVAWAVVHLDGERLGVYVLKESFEKEFLRCFFEKADGNLYDGGFLNDVDRHLERDGGYGPADHSDLKELAAVAQERDEAERWRRLQEVLDVERFATYAALSVMLVDWDGYPLNRNNYRVYFNPADGRAVFMPHGMDQILQRTYLEMDQGWSGLMAWAVFSTTPGQALYEAKCREVYTNVFTFPRISNLVSRAAAVLQPVRRDMPHVVESYHDQVLSRLRVLKRDPLLKPPVSLPAGGSGAPRANP